MDPHTAPVVLCLMGPTATGKSDLALALAERIPCQIISVDSAMVYRGMDIGTAKPSQALLREVPHKLVDIRDPADPYSAALFCEDATQAIHESLAQGKIPLLVGGTMLYFKALQQGLSDLPPADPAIRAQLDLWTQEAGITALHAHLQKVDPAAAQRIKPTDKQRIQRALEVYQSTGRPLSELQTLKTQKNPSLFQFINLVLLPTDREVLHQKISLRFDEMLEKGFLEEVEKLFHRGDLSLDNPSIRSVGYQQAWLYLLGEIERNLFREKAIIATRQLAKRQLTWLRALGSSAHYFLISQAHLLDAVLNYLLESTALVKHKLYKKHS